MHELLKSWRELPLDKKLSAVFIPIFVAVLVTVVIPAIRSLLKSEATPVPAVRDAKLQHLEVETGVTAAEFADRQTTIAFTPSGGGRFVAVAAPVQAEAAPSGTDPPVTSPTITTKPPVTTPPVQPPEPSTPGPSSPHPPSTRPPARPPGVLPGDGRDIHGDRDRDRVADTKDNCPDRSNPDQANRDGDPQGDACEWRTATQQVQADYDLGCTDAKLESALEDSAATCDPVKAVAGETASRQRARQVLVTLRASRGQTASNGKIGPVGVIVRYEVTLIGFLHRRADVAWSLYRRHGAQKAIPRPWRFRHRILPVKGEVNTDPGSHAFWIPLPRSHGPYYLKLVVFDRDGDVRSRNTRSFD